MKHHFLILISTFAVLTSCKEDLFYFPGNIAFFYCIDKIQIDEPVLYCKDSVHIYVTSAEYLENIEKDNVDSCIFLYPIVTEGDLQSIDWAYGKNSNNEKLMEQLISQNGRFLSFDYFDYSTTLESGGAIYHFKVEPKCFYVMLMPSYIYMWPPDTDVYSYIAGRQQHLVLFPAYTSKQRKSLLEIRRTDNNRFSSHLSYLFLYKEINPFEWSESLKEYAKLYK